MVTSHSADPYVNTCTHTHMYRQWVIRRDQNYIDGKWLDVVCHYGKEQMNVSENGRVHFW